MSDPSIFTAIDLTGFQVVHGQFFKVDKLPYMNIFPREISFARETHEMLHNCESIQILINEEGKTIVIKAAPSSEENSVRWVRNTKDTYIPRYTCPKLTAHIYTKWGWNSKYRYKTDGVLVHCDGKPVILFDFNKALAYPVNQIRNNNEQ